MSFTNKMQLKEEDVTRIITACKLAQESTGSEWTWDEYETLVNKLNVYKDQYSTD